MRLKLTIVCSIIFIAISFNGYAFSWDIDSIARKGSFLRFCANTYKWADNFFNGSDTTYVQSAGYKMNVKLRTSSWSDLNEFYFDGNDQIRLCSPTTATVGFDVAYMAIALGYDVNINKLFGAVDRTKSRFNFDFSSALISGRFYRIKNDYGMNLTSIGEQQNINYFFKDVATSTWGIDVFCYFNSKRYSNAAATNFGKIQRKSQGSFIAGFAIQHSKMDFDFSTLPDNLKSNLPESWRNKHYYADGNTFGIAGGYGFNWVPKQKFNIGVIGIIIPGLNFGHLNSETKSYSFRINYRCSLSASYNHKRWFAGIVAKSDLAKIYSVHSTLTNAQWSVEAKVGWRFNIW